MGEDSAAVVSVEAMIGTAREMVPRLRERYQETATGRRLPDETLAELLDLGVVGMLTPTELGGPGLGCDELFDVLVELARGCPSASWVAGVYGIHIPLLTAFPIEAQEEVFANGPAPLISTAFSPLRASTRAEGEGAVITGQWDFSSGIDFADWVVVMAVSETGPLAHLVPTSEMQIIDTWFTTGLRGTGSKDVAAQDLYVPPHRVMPLSDVTTAAGFIRAHRLYGMPYARVPFSLVVGTGVVGTALGAAQGAVEVFTEQTAEKVGGLSGIKGRDRTDIHSRLGKSIGDVEAAILIARNCYAEIRALGEADRDLTEAEWVAARARCGWATRLAHEGVERLFEAGGANSLRTEDPFGALYRDHVAASHHFGIQVDTYETARGRQALGLEGIIKL